MNKNEDTTDKVPAKNDLHEPDTAAPEETVKAPKGEEKASEQAGTQPAKSSNRFKRFVATKKGKVLLGIGALIVIAAVLLAIPTTRYGILGTFVKKNVSVMVMDSSTMKPVSQATVVLGDTTAKTDKKGEVTLSNVAVGEYKLQVTKGYYKASEAAYTVPVLGDVKQTHVSLVATGRQVVLNVSNKITNAVLAGATVTVKDTSAVTDDKGVATIVLPADKKTFEGTVSLDGYNQTAVEIKVTDQADANKVSLTPAGDIYYLSKQTGKINVMKSQLDGSAASVVVEGTGNEKDRETVLLAARNWNYMVLSAKRDTAKVERIYVVDAKTGGLKVIDEGDATFQLVGWSDHKFIYTATRNNRNMWESGTQRLKSYDADTGKLTILDEISAAGTNEMHWENESIQNAYILDNKIVYVKQWNRAQYMTYTSEKKSAIMTVNPDGSQKQRVKEFAMEWRTYIDAKLYEPQEVYFRVTIDTAQPVYYEYENGAVKSVSNTDEKFYSTAYPTYLVSPNGQKTFWYEPRDGKNTLIVGDKNGKDGVTLSSQSEYKTYGWYTDKYVLVTKNNSELYITSSEKVLEQPYKITNYHKPDVSFPGYGYGYGGQ